MKKKLLLALCITMITATCFAGCGGAGNGTNENGDIAASENEAEEASVCDVEGHDFEEATCSAPKTCKVCGETEGEALGHEFSLRTVDAPATCTICGETEGEPIKVDVREYDITGYDYWLFSDDVYVLYKFNGWNTGNCSVVSDIYNNDGTLIRSEERNMVNKKTTYYMNWEEVNDEEYGLILGFDGVEGTNGSAICDINGDIVWSTTDYTKYYIAGVTEKDGHLVAEFIDLASGKNTVYVDTVTNEEITLVEDTEEETYEYDETKWNYFAKDDKTGYFLVGNDEQWGFLDADMNEVKMYMDVSNFNEAGYALASDDRETYYIIDTDFNVVGENVVSGNGSSYWGYGNKFTISYEADTNKRTFVSIE